MRGSAPIHAGAVALAQAGPAAESYGDGADTLWYDDVVAGALRNHC